MTRRARPPERFRDLVVRHAELVDEPRHRLRLIDRVQILALQILDQRHGERGLVRQLANDDGTVGSPASRAARQRRSPATIS